MNTDLPCVDRIGVPIISNTVFGGSGCVGNETSDSCNLCRKTSKALVVTFLLNNNFYTNKIAEKWEKEVFIDEINKFNENQKLLGDGELQLKIDYMAERSIPDDLGEQNVQNILVVLLSYVLMFVYIAVSMGNFPSLILSRFLVAFGGIMVVVLSFASALAIVSFFGIKMSLISTEVVPFLVLAIGVDNMFIIVGAKDRKKKENLNEHMAHTLKEVIQELVMIGRSLNNHRSLE
ncbi:MAG: hypothetical protein GY861_19900 [bacterium]|nr:hypothetical protein [bacterium]